MQFLLHFLLGNWKAEERAARPLHFLSKKEKKDHEGRDTSDQMPIDPWLRAQATMHDWFGMNGWNMCEEYILFTTIHEWRNNQILIGRA